MIVVIIGDEILHRIVGEKFSKLPIQLRRQGFVGRHDDRRPLNSFDNLSDRKGLTRPRNSEQSLVTKTILKASNNAINSMRLVPCRRKPAFDF